MNRICFHGFKNTFDSFLMHKPTKLEDLLHADENALSKVHACYHKLTVCFHRSPFVKVKYFHLQALISICIRR